MCIWSTQEGVPINRGPTPIICHHLILGQNATLNLDIMSSSRPCGVLPAAPAIPANLGIWPYILRRMLLLVFQNTTKEEYNISPILHGNSEIFGAYKLG